MHLRNLSIEVIGISSTSTRRPSIVQYQSRKFGGIENTLNLLSLMKSIIIKGCQSSSKRVRRQATLNPILIIRLLRMNKQRILVITKTNLSAECSALTFIELILEKLSADRVMTLEKKMLINNTQLLFAIATPMTQTLLLQNVKTILS